MAVAEVSGVRCVQSVVSVLPEYHRTVHSIVKDLVQRAGLFLSSIETVFLLILPGYLPEPADERSWRLIGMAGCYDVVVVAVDSFLHRSGVGLYLDGDIPELT